MPAARARAFDIFGNYAQAKHGVAGSILEPDDEVAGFEAN